MTKYARNIDPTGTTSPQYVGQVVRNAGVMGTLQEQLASLRNFNSQTRVGDGPQSVMPEPETLEEAVKLESIVMRRERPVLAIQSNEAELVFQDDGGDAARWRRGPGSRSATSA